ncbi:Aquaporin, partial [Caligus rogercresseyi]
ADNYGVFSYGICLFLLLFGGEPDGQRRRHVPTITLRMYLGRMSLKETWFELLQRFVGDYFVF